MPPPRRSTRIVPYEIAGRATTLMQVVYRNTPSSTINLQVAAAAPGIFVDIDGSGRRLQPGRQPSTDRPIRLLRTRRSCCSPPGRAPQRRRESPARVIPVDPTQLKHPVLPVSATIGGVPADVQYAGSAPGLVSGAFQVNLLVPVAAPSGGAVPVVLTVGTVSSQGRATLAIQ